MPIIDEKLLKQNLIRDEGIETRPYFDSKGYPTWGVGHNLEARPLTPEQKNLGKDLGFDSMTFAMKIFHADVRNVLTELYQNLPWLKNHPEQVQRALANMAFQMGVGGLLQFEKTLPLIKEGNYKQASYEMEDSKWFREDSPRRAQRVITLVRHAV